MRTPLILLMVVALGCAMSWWRLTDGFSLARITDSLPYEARWELPSPPIEKLRAILNQPFTYMGKGTQCYLFVSEDQKYVLKFLRLDRYRLSRLQQTVPLPRFLHTVRDQMRENRETKREQLFTSCTLAYRELRAETGLLYVHLNKTDHLKQELLLYDKLHRPHKLDSDSHAFVIQTKGEQIYAYLAKLIHEGHFQEARHALQQLAQLIEQRQAKQIGDHDTAVHKNSGFYQGNPLFFDIGQFYPSKRPIRRSCDTEKLVQWLEKQEASIGEEARKIFSSDR